MAGSVFSWNCSSAIRRLQAFGLETNRRAIFVYPDSLHDPELGAVAWAFSSTAHDVPFFEALITELAGSYCVDMDRIFALGVSSGGIMSNKLGCFLGDTAPSLRRRR